MTNVLSTSPLIISIYLCEFFLLLRSIMFKYPLHTAIGFLISCVSLNNEFLSVFSFSNSFSELFKFITSSLFDKSL